MQAGLTALMFIVGSIFTTGWYVAAAVEETLMR